VYGSVTAATRSCRARWLGALLTLSLAAACGVDETPSKDVVDWSRLPFWGAAPKPLVIAVYPAMESRMQPLADYLTRSLHWPVKLVSEKSYEKQIELVKSGVAQAATFAPLSCVQARSALPITLLAKASRSGVSSYFGYLVADKKSSLASLESLKNKRVAWVDPLSTSGYLFVRDMMEARGKNPDAFFKEQVFAGNQHDAIRMVTQGKVDVAAASSRFIDDTPLHSRIAEASSLRVVAKTAHIPLDCFVVSNNLQRQFAQRVQHALLQLENKPSWSYRLMESWGLDSFAELDGHDYDAVDAALIRSMRKAKANALGPST